MKLWISAVLLFCVTQTLTNPVEPESKGLIEDIIAAEKAIDDFIASCNALYDQTVSSATVIVNTIITTTESIITQLKEIGVDQQDIDSIQLALDTCVTNITNIVTELLKDITDLVALLNDILTHLDNPVQLAIDVVELEAQIDKLKQDYSTAFARIKAELKALEQAILDVLVGQPIEIVNSIIAEMEAAKVTIMGEYHKVLDALTACLAAGEAAVAAIYAIIS